MRMRFVAACAAVSFLVGAATAQTTTNWILDILLVRSAETTVLRHPIEKSRYYLCWFDGSDRYGFWFRDGSLSTKLRNIKPGQRVPLSNLLSATGSTWSAEDEQLCFPT